MFLNVQFSGIKCIHIVVQPLPPPISRTLSSSQTETLFLLDNKALCPFSSAPGYHHSICVSMNLNILGTSYEPLRGWGGGLSRVSKWSALHFKNLLWLLWEWTAVGQVERRYRVKGLQVNTGRWMDRACLWAARGWEHHRSPDNNKVFGWVRRTEKPSSWGGPEGDDRVDYSILELEGSS